MVLAQKVGTARHPGLVILLYVVTFGIYGLYWHFKAHDEVVQQFELDRRGRRTGTIWLLLDRFFLPLRWVYQYGFVQNVEHVRERMALGVGIRTGTFLVLSVGGHAALFVALMLGLIGAPVEEGADIRWWALQAAALAAVTGLAMQVVAYVRLQGSLNGVWAGYEARMQELAPMAGSPPGSAPPSAAAALAWQPVR